MVLVTYRFAVELMYEILFVFIGCEFLFFGFVYSSTITIKYLNIYRVQMEFFLNLNLFLVTTQQF